MSIMPLEMYYPITDTLTFATNEVWLSIYLYECSTTKHVHLFACVYSCMLLVCICACMMHGRDSHDNLM